MGRRIGGSIMKTRYYIMIAFAAIAAAACSKELEESVSGNVKTEGTVREFSVAMEQPVTRTVLNSDFSVSWVSGDKISVFAGSDNKEFTLNSIDTDGKGIFSGEADGSDFYLLYPYNASASISAGVITTVLPCDQTGIAGTFAPGLNQSVAHTDGASVTMSNVFGLIEFTLSRSDIASVTISSTTHEYLTGKVEISIDGSGIPSCALVNGTRYVSVHPEGSTFAPGTYYAAVLPGTYSNGLVMTLTTASKAAVRKNTSSAKVKRSHILGAGTVDSGLTLSDIISLDDAETANFYVAGAAGRRYKMPVTVMGNGYTLAEDSSAPAKNGVAPGLAPLPLTPKSAQLLWQTSADLVNDVVYEDGYVYFTLNGSVGGSLNPGNASIAAYSGENCTGDILWSWHIWVTDADLDSKLQTWTVHSDYASYSNYVSPQLMDRNLGALCNEPWSITGNNLSFGLLYQWGRKDPFIGPDDASKTSSAKRITYDAAGNQIPVVTTSAQSSAIEWGVLPVLQHPDYNSTSNPNVYPSPALTAKYPMRFTKVGNGMWLRPNMNDLWGFPAYEPNTNFIGHKTIYDPCPPGYRVMNPYAMSNAIPASNVGGEYATLGDGNILNKDTFADDGGVKVSYDGVTTHFTWIPSNGFITYNTTYNLGRAGNYGYLWTCKASPTNHNGVNVYFDVNHFYSMGTGTRSSYGHGIRCEKVK